MTYDIEEDGHTTVSKSELIWLFGFFATLIVFTTVDVIEDWNENIPLRHIIPEIVVALFSVFSVSYIFRKFAKNRKETFSKIKTELQQAKQTATDWKNKAQTLKSGISQAISEQLEKWELTKSEQEIAFLLIKGLSTKEIAEIRETSEGTIRLQCSVIYKKSGLPGRAQLSAFFLEDLLI
jgi:DNA-binding CsgD family transcriptional regulator